MRPSLCHSMGHAGKVSLLRWERSDKAWQNKSNVKLLLCFEPSNTLSPSWCLVLCFNPFLRMRLKGYRWEWVLLNRRLDLPAAVFTLYRFHSPSPRVGVSALPSHTESVDWASRRSPGRRMQKILFCTLLIQESLLRSSSSWPMRMRRAFSQGEREKKRNLGHGSTPTIKIWLVGWFEYPIGKLIPSCEALGIPPICGRALNWGWREVWKNFQKGSGQTGSPKGRREKELIH